MTDEKQQFADRAKAKFLAAFDAKFAKGDAEHKDDLFKIDVLRETYDEALDLITYLSVALEMRRSEYERGYADGFRAAIRQSEPSEPETD